MSAAAIGFPQFWARRAGEALAPFAAPAIWSHAARTTAAALLALFLAFVFELDTPYSAMNTVLIVSNPVQGMILAKSLYRFVGTLLGGVVAVTLMAAFPQSPTLFLLGLAAWLGVCTAASTLLRGFRSYGAVLAGYTVALIAMPVVDQPQNIFTVALARVAVVSLGIGSSALIGALLTGPTAERSLEKLLRGLLAGLLAYGRAALHPGRVGDLQPLRRNLGARLGALDAAIQLASAETPRAAGQASSLRAASAALFGALTAAPGLAESLGAIRARRPFLSEGLDEAERLILAAEAALVARDDAELGACAQKLGLLRARLGAAFETGGEALSPEAVTAIDRLEDMTGELERGLLGLAGLRTGAFAALRPHRAATHLDWRWAALNAVRAAVAVLLAGALWLGLGWPLGASMMAAVMPSVALLSLRERPSSDALDLVWGVALATALGLFFLLWVLPQITGFPLLSLWIGPVLMVAAAMMTVPRLMFVGVGLGVFFSTLLAPSNPMQYDPEGFMNNALATMAGTALTSLVYRIVLPVDAQGLRRHLLAEIRRDLADLLRRRRNVSGPEWESRMHDRLRLLTARLRAANIAGEASLRNGFAALRLGRDVLRLRALIRDDPPAQALTRAALTELAGDRSAGVIARTIADLRAHAESLEPGQAAKTLRAAAILPAIAALAARHRRFFQQVLQ